MLRPYWAEETRIGRYPYVVTLGDVHFKVTCQMRRSVTISQTMCPVSSRASGQTSKIQRGVGSKTRLLMVREIASLVPQNLALRTRCLFHRSALPQSTLTPPLHFGEGLCKVGGTLLWETPREVGFAKRCTIGSNWDWPPQWPWGSPLQGDSQASVDQ